MVGGRRPPFSCIGAPVGFVNGLLVTRVRIDSFIATLGTGTVLYGLNAWYTGGQQVLASLPPAVPCDIRQHRDRSRAGDLCARRRASILWVVFEYLPLGRYLYVLGASPRAAELNGISAKRYVTLGFVAAGTLAAFAGIVLQSQLRSARVRSARNISCRPSLRRCSARPRSGPAGSTSGARSSPSPCSP